MKQNKVRIPMVTVSVDTVGDLIAQMRNRKGNNAQPVPAPGEAFARFDSSKDDEKGSGKKESDMKSVIPKTVVSLDSVGEMINQIRKEGQSEETNEEPVTREAQEEPKEAVTEESKTPEVPEDKQKKQEEAMKSIIPKTVVSVPTDLDQISDLLSSGREIEIKPDGTLSAVGKGKSKKSKEAAPSGKTATIPKTVVSVGQWYQRPENKDLYNMEVEAMRREFNDPTLEPQFMEDGTMYWIVNTTPNLGEGYNCMTYKLLLVYDKDHPRVRYGSSVKCYLVDPNLEDLQNIINQLPNISPKFIPHTLSDEKGNRYLCSVDTANVSADLNSKGGVTSAVTSYRFAYRWLTILELGLRHPKTWEKFQKHGEI